MSAFSSAGLGSAGATAALWLEQPRRERASVRNNAAGRNAPPCALSAAYAPAGGGGRPCRGGRVKASMPGLHGSRRSAGVCKAASRRALAGYSQVPPFEGSASPDGSPPPTALQRLLAFLDAQFLPVGLLTAVAAGVAFPSPGIMLNSVGASNLCAFGIFFLSGLSLKQTEAKQAVSAIGALLYGVATILGFTALVAPLCLLIPLQPEGLRLGLAVFCCVPTTLSSGIALTQTAGGNTAMALLLTVVSNVLGVFTMPFTIWWAVGSSVSISPVPLLQSLVQAIMVPLLLGMAARRLWPRLGSFANSRKKAVSKVQSSLQIMVPWMQVSKSVAAFAALQVGSLVVIAIAGLAIHGVFLAFNLVMVRGLKLGGKPHSPEAVAIQRAVVILGSQKTLPVAVAVIGSMSESLGGTAGLLALPCIVAHVTQIIADSLLVSHWLKQPTNSPK